MEQLIAALEYMMSMNLDAMNSERARVDEHVEEMHAFLATDNWNSYDARLWTDGEVAKDFTRLASLIMRQRTLLEAYDMAKSLQGDE